MNRSEMTYFRELSNFLAGIYGDADNARRVAAQAGLNLSMINFDGSAAVVWSNIVTEARKSNRGLIGLLQVGVSDYPSNQTFVELFRSMPIVDSVANGIEQLSQQVAGIDRKVSALGQQVNGLSQQVAGLSAQVSANQGA